MSDVVIKVENVGKQYHLGKVGTGTIANDLNRWWHIARGKEDPYLKIGSVNYRTSKSSINDIVWAVKDISFEVKQGEVLGIIGKNGAGKSTLLKILSRVTAPTTGDIKVKGRIASLLEVGTGFHPDLSGRENIFLNGAILGMTKQEIKSKFDEIVDFSGVERYIDTPVKRYSSGMYVRLAFAVAAHLEPEILIVDEVLAVGDAEFQKKCLGKMKDVSGQGRTVIFVSHNMAAVKSLCTRGIVLEHGELKYSGNSEAAIDFYTRSSYSLAEIPLVERTDRKGNGKLRITEIQFLNNLNTQVAELTSGEYYKIQFHFEKHQEIDLKQLTFVLQFKNENDDLVSTIATDEQATIFDNIGSRGYFEVEMPRLAFREGKYLLNYMISEKLSYNTPHVTIDFLADAVIMDVIRGDYWNSGVLNRPKGFIQESSISIINTK